MAVPVRAQQDFSAVEIETIPVVAGIYMLMGVGGNIGLSVGEDGVFLVDDQYAPLSEKILAAVAEQSDAPVEFVVNTHWHWDHVGGNEILGEMGAVLIAHENTRKRMSTTQFVEALGREETPSPAGALPVITFEDGVTFHWNGDEWDPADAPTIRHRHFTGTGTRFIEDNGREAIRDLMRRSFG